jgi:hypothetical protein
MNNDIDVSKCKHYHHYYVIDDCKLEHYCDESFLTCGEGEECCYRQLQRKTQECEKRKKCLNEIKNICKFLTNSKIRVDVLRFADEIEQFICEVEE